MYAGKEKVAGSSSVQSVVDPKNNAKRFDKKPFKDIGKDVAAIVAKNFPSKKDFLVMVRLRSSSQSSNDSDYEDTTGSDESESSSSGVICSSSC